MTDKQTTRRGAMASKAEKLPLKVASLETARGGISLEDITSLITELFDRHFETHRLAISTEIRSAIAALDVKVDKVN